MKDILTFFCRIKKQNCRTRSNSKRYMNQRKRSEIVGKCKSSKIWKRKGFRGRSKAISANQSHTTSTNSILALFRASSLLNQLQLQQHIPTTQIIVATQTFDDDQTL